MKIALFGATGPSGLEVVKEALQRGHEVTALVRNPDKITETHEKLKVVKVDLYNPDTLVDHMKGQDAVLSCLGCKPSWFSMWTIAFYTDTAKTIVEALRKSGQSRFIFMSSWYTKYDSSDSFIINWVLKPMFLGQTLHNMGQMEDYLATECPDIDFTSVKPPQLTNFESQGKPISRHEGQKVPGKSHVICRRDVAKFMLDIAESGDYKRKNMAITSS